MMTNSATKRFDLQLDVNRLALARDALMVDDQAKVLANDHAVVHAHARNTIAGYQQPAEDMIHIGDQHVHNETTPAAQPRKPGLSPLLSGLIGAGLMATGVGGYFGLGLIADAIKQLPSSGVTTPGDGNTKYQLNLLP